MGGFQQYLNNLRKIEINIVKNITTINNNMYAYHIFIYVVFLLWIYVIQSFTCVNR